MRTAFEPLRTAFEPLKRREYSEKRKKECRKRLQQGLKGNTTYDTIRLGETDGRRLLYSETACSNAIVMEGMELCGLVILTGKQGNM